MPHILCPNEKIQVISRNVTNWVQDCALHDPVNARVQRSLTLRAVSRMQCAHALATDHMQIRNTQYKAGTGIDLGTRCVIQQDLCVTTWVG